MEVGRTVPRGGEMLRASPGLADLLPGFGARPGMLRKMAEDALRKAILANPDDEAARMIDRRETYLRGAA